MGKELQSFRRRLRFLTPLKARGHRAVSQTMYLFDGHLCEPQGRLFLGRHALLFHPEHGIFKLPDILSLEHRDWPFTMRCRVHAAHKAAEWSLKPYRSDDTADVAHIAIESLRNHSSPIQDDIETFMRRYVIYVERDEDPADREYFGNVWMFPMSCWMLMWPQIHCGIKSEKC